MKCESRAVNGKLDRGENAEQEREKYQELHQSFSLHSGLIYKEL